MNKTEGTWNRTYESATTPEAWKSHISCFTAINDYLDVRSDISICTTGERSKTTASISLTPAQMREFAQTLINAADRIERLEIEAIQMRQARLEAAA